MPNFREMKEKAAALGRSALAAAVDNTPGLIERAKGLNDRVTLAVEYCSARS